MRQQTAAGAHAGCVLSFCKDDLRAGGISTRVDGTGRSRCTAVVVNSYATEIVTKALFHKPARRCFERLAFRTQNVLNDWRHAIDMAFTAASQQICAYRRISRFALWFD